MSGGPSGRGRGAQPSAFVASALAMKSQSTVSPSSHTVTPTLALGPFVALGLLRGAETGCPLPRESGGDTGVLCFEIAEGLQENGGRCRPCVAAAAPHPSPRYLHPAAPPEPTPLPQPPRGIPPPQCLCPEWPCPQSVLRVSPASLGSHVPAARSGAWGLSHLQPLDGKAAKNHVAKPVAPWGDVVGPGPRGDGGCARPWAGTTTSRR